MMTAIRKKHYGSLLEYQKRLKEITNKPHFAVE